MTKKAHLVGAVVASAGLLVAGAPAYADSVDNDGVNIANDNNIDLLPVQLCGNNIAVLGAVVPLLSPQATECTQAPITDHPHTGSDHDGSSGDDGRTEPGENSTLPDGHPVPDAPPPGKVIIPANQSGDLPEAPAPEPIRGHHAVTG